MPNVSKYYNINVKKTVISTFKCQDLQVLLFPCFCWSACGGTIHPSQVQGLCVFAWDRSNKKMQSGED